MLTVEEWMDVKQLFNEGHSRRAIARLTGYSRNTERKGLKVFMPDYARVRSNGGILKAPRVP